jgi:uncharacterized membrane protein YbhN (UPF0104 family)
MASEDRPAGGPLAAPPRLDAARLRVAARRLAQHPWARRIGVALTVVALAALALQLQRHADLLRAQMATPDLSRLALSLIPLLAAYAAQARAWRVLAVAAGADLAWPAAFGVLYLAQIGKYLPGAIWGYLGAVHWGLRAGIAPASATYAQVGLAIAESAVAVALGILALAWIARGDALFTLFLAIALGVAVWVGGVLALRWLARVCYGGRPAVHTVASLLGWIALHWLAFASGYGLLLGALWPVSLGDAALACMLHAAAWLVGYWALVVPGGLGVRELVHATLLAAVLPAPVALVVPLLTRLWLTVGDALACALAAAIALDRRLQRRDIGTPT